jgi:uncharacterized repeat protein (TIGR01451 family)
VVSVRATGPRFGLGLFAPRDDQLTGPAALLARAMGMKKPAARLLALVVAAATAMSPLAAQRTDAAVVLTVTPLTWNVIGLDSNSPASGPNRFPVGARVCVTAGSTTASAVTADFVWDSSNPYIALRPGSLATIDLGSISAGSCADAYFEFEVTRTAAAYDTTRSYHITATDSVSGATASTPRPRELYVEHLISQSRNGIESIKLNGVSIPAGGSMTLVVGNTYTIELAGHTATQGYNQLESFINFPNTIFQTLAVSTTYTSNTSPYVASPNDKLYADACLWENDPNSPNYRSCVGGDGKAGGTVVTTYTVKIISGAGSSQTLSSLLYDFSGSSYHYNADFGVGFRTANIVAPASVTISKTFTPKAISPGGTSTLTFTLSNPTTDSFTGVHFADTFPAGMSVAGTPGIAYSGCGSGAFSPVPVAGDTSVAFSNATLAPNGVCTITVDVTAPAGTYDNTTGHLFINTSIDTGNVGQDTLVASAAPACIPGQTLATWTMPASGQGSGGPPPPFTTRAANVASATASTSAGMTNSIVSGEGNPPNAWAGQGFEKTGTPDGDTGPYFQFAVDTSQYTGAAISLDFKRDPNWGGGSSDTPTMYLYSSATGSAGSFTLIATASSLTTGWQSTGNTAAAATGSGATYFRINARGTNSVASSQLFLDNVAVSGCGVPAPSPTITKSFAPDPIVLGATSTLTFTIANTAVGSRALTGVAFSDVLPAGLSIAGSSSAPCGGTVTTTAATRAIALTGGQISAGGSCTFGVAVTGSAEGHYDNVTGFISSTEGGTSTSYATDSLTVIAPPELGKSFSPTSILTGGTSALAFTITNPNRQTALSGIGFNDTLPAGLTVASSGPTSTCGGSLTTTAPDSISFSGGSLAANGTCTFSATVTGATAGSKVNSTSAVTSTEGGTGNAATATLVVSDAVAFIDLNKQVSSDGINWFKFVGVPVGGPVYYRFSVYNGGDIPFTSISVGDPTPIACTWTGTAYPPLAQGETAVCVTGPIAAISGLHANTATATGTYATGTTTSSPSTATYGTTELTIAKSAAESFFTAAGNVLHYSYLVTNSGFAPLLGPVTVADDKATDEACPGVGTVGDLDNYLDPGESIPCTATYTVQPADVTAGSVTNTASATVGGVTSGTSTRTVGLAALTIGKTANPTSTSTTGPISYTITVTNTGTVDLTGVVLGDPLTAGASLVSGDTTDPGVLDVGEVWIYGATYTVTAADLTAGTPIVNTATVDTDQTAPASASATTTISQGPALAVAKSSTTASITAAGQVVPYTFSLTNTGNVSLTAISVSDPACDAAPAYVSGDTNSDSTLGTSETWTYACDRTVTQAELNAGGNLSNTVTADAAESAPATDTLDIPIVQSPALTIAKSFTSGDRYAAVGDVITYEYRVLNSGNVTVGGPITVTDDRTSVACPATSSLDPGATVTCTAAYSITQDDLSAGSVTNIATATGVFGGGQVASATVSASARSAASPPLPPSSAFDPLRDLGGGLSAIGAWLLLVAALTTVAFLLVPALGRGRNRR